MARILHGLVIAALAGCVASNAVVCQDGRVCPQATVCDDTHQLCVSQDQITECTGMADLAPCPQGACHDGVCLPSLCGNGRVDPGEACDDGNTASGDGCSADCHSDETCGNGVIDSIAGEQCDDGNHLDHDGCSSACSIENTDWVQVVDPSSRTVMGGAYDATRNQVVMYGGSRVQADVTDAMSEWNGIWRSNIDAIEPPARLDFAMAYDHDLRRVILFGGAQDPTAAASNDTWAWDGIGWTRLADGPPRAAASMVYDSKRHRLVLFGGHGETETATNNTFEFDGTTWTDVTPATSPPPRLWAGMAYDPLRGVTVLFGGNDRDHIVDLADTWQYDGHSWTNVTPAAPMVAVQHPGLAYLASTHATLLFGGFRSYNADPNGTSATYLWNGTTWTLIPGATPSARGGEMLVENGRGGAILFGGSSSQYEVSVYADTWQFDGSQWTQVVAPSARSNFPIVDEPDQGKVVLFGGKNGSLFTDTWELSAAGWKQYPDGPLPNDAPPPTDTPNMVYDSGRGQLVLFGGVKSGNIYDTTTWLRTGTSWAPHNPVASPGGRQFHGMAYDAGRGVTIMFGGSNGAPLNDTWQWDGTSWTQLTPAHSPGARVAPAMAYDRARGVIVLFGGVGDDNGNSVPETDTWIWDGSDWHAVSVTDGPPFRTLASFVWDPARAVLVLAGGEIGSNDTFDAWAWIGSASDPTTGVWQEINAVHHPAGRFEHGAFASLDGSGISLLDGIPTQINGAPIAELWQLRTVGPRASDACIFPIDADGDDLVGCADPDCWRICTPDCPPGTSCPAAAPRCGDGVCSPIESCHSCPGDCPTCTPVCGDFVCDPGEVCPGDCG